MKDSKKLKELSLNAILEGGDVKGFLDAHLRDEDMEIKRENTKVLKSFARLSDMVTQHAKGVFVEEISDNLTETLAPLVENLSSKLDEGMKAVAEDISQLTQETNDQVKAQLESNIEKGLRDIKAEVSSVVSGDMRSALDSAMSQLAQDAKLTEDEIEEIVTNAALSVESQIPSLLASYISDAQISVENIKNFKEEVNKAVEPFDISKAAIMWGQIKGAPQMGGVGKSKLAFMGDVNADGITNGQTLLWNSTTGKFEAGSVDALPSQTGNGGKYLTTDGTTASWATLAGGGDMAAATYDPATISEQLVGLTATQTLTNKTLTQPTLVLKQGTAPAPTAEGDIQWDTDDNKIKIGDGATTKTFSDDAYNASTFAAASHTHTLSDVTDSGALAALNTVGTTEIDNAAVTFAKMQDIATNRILGRSTAGTGSIEALADADARTIMGLATTDSPQFNAINLGHATDTTLTRVSAGVVAVEGVNIQLQPTEGGFVDGDKTKLDGIEASADVTDTANVTAAGALMDSELTDIAFIKATSDAAASDVNTGTDANKAITPDALAGSNFGIRYVQIRVFEASTDTATGDGKATFHVPPGLDGMNLVYVHAEVDTAGTTGTTDIQIHNADNALDMLSTKLTIDSAETGSDTAATAAVINTSNDHVNTNDIVRIDVDAVSTTAAQGLLVTLGFQLP